MSKLGAAAAKSASSAASRMKALTGEALKKKKKLVPGTAYKITKPATKAASKLKNMAASCQACSGK